MGNQRGYDFAFVQGNTGSAQDDSGNPVKIGGYASETPPTAVTAGQRVNTWHDLNGRVMVNASSIPPTIADGTMGGPLTFTISGTTTAQTIVPAPGAGNFVFIESVFCSNSHATTSVDISLIENSSTLVKGHLAHKGGGFVWEMKRGWKLHENQAFQAQLSSAVPVVYVNVQFYVST